MGGLVATGRLKSQVVVFHLPDDAMFLSTSSPPVALYPLELIKTRMQVISDSAGTYRSLTRSFREVLRNEGVKGLYQGMSPALLGASGSWGGYFYFYEKSKERKARRNLSSGGTSTLQTFDHVSSYGS